MQLVESLSWNSEVLQVTGTRAALSQAEAVARVSETQKHRMVGVNINVCGPLRDELGVKSDGWMKDSSLLMLASQCQHHE